MDVQTKLGYSLHTSVLEGINNKNKVIKCMAYGYRDDDSFLPKIRQAFPGVGDVPDKLTPMASQSEHSDRAETRHF